MNTGELLTGIISGTGATIMTGALVYGVRQIRKVAARIEQVMSTPALVESLQGTVGSLAITVQTNTSAIGNLSEALNRLTGLVEKRVNGG